MPDGRATPDRVAGLEARARVLAALIEPYLRHGRLIPVALDTEMRALSMELRALNVEAKVEATRS